MIKAEYLRFLQTLQAKEVSEGVVKLANLIQENLELLSPLGTSQGQRIKQVVSLSQENWDCLSAEIQGIPESAEEQSENITQLKSLTVGPFRGFSEEEVFDLTSRLVLIYGPNGTGKSSFCEALEYGLLGSVAEAESKRFRNQQSYLKNAYVNRFSPPTIIGLNDQSEEVKVLAKEELYRFCFVERNRIDNFSRIAAQAPAKQAELISTLFGLDSFNDFVRKFTNEIDPKYIDLSGLKSAQLSKSRQDLVGFHQQIERSEAGLHLLDEEQQKLADEYGKNLTFDEMVIELNGDAHSSGLIKQLEVDIQQPKATKSALTIDALELLRQQISDDSKKLNDLGAELANASQEISFKNLYEAVTQLRLSSPDSCPACDTPLNQVTKNPFIYAGEELIRLQHLAGQQQTFRALEHKLHESICSVAQIVSLCCERITSDVLTDYLVESSSQANADWWSSLHHDMADNTTAWQHLQSQVSQLEEVDRTIDQAAQVLSEKQAELERLRGFAHQVTVLSTRRQATQQSVVEAQCAIESFEAVNSELISDAQEESVTVERNQVIADSYQRFVIELNNYKDSLPEQLVADLGDIVVTLYNSFNRNDSPAELLASLRLPLAQSQRLEISFQTNPDKFFDPLHILSEGHIRCIGLSILLAKNLKENCPILIFDDPVNAIDDEHRESIRRTLFEDEYFAGKQIILTCHGEEFFKDIQNLLPSQEAARAQSLTFLPRLDEPHIRVDFGCAPRNYIIAAREHFDRNEIRDALSKSRKALESLTKVKIWRYVSKYGDGNLSLKLRSSTSPIELRNLTEQLKTKINHSGFSDSNKSSVFDPISTLLGLNGGSREWRYLNKGTHEENDRSEFDRQTVGVLISALESLDQALSK